jgi:uncharacterized damage-inducible protein DinB
MTELERISDQIRRAYEGEAWHGPAVKEVLADVTAEMAVRRPIAGAHSIWELVHHIAAWTDIVRRRISGEDVQVTTEVDWPPVSNSSNEAWNESLQRLDRSQRELLDILTGLQESRLEQPAVKGGATIYVVLHGLAQHHTYHAGQIAILKLAQKTIDPGPTLR